VSDGYLTNQFLIAMPGMSDPNFAQTVTYVCEHGPRGALGIVINRPLEMNMGEVFHQLQLTAVDEALSATPVYFGGPVQTDRGFVLHSPDGEWESTLRISPQVYMTTSRDVLEALARGSGPRQSLVALGYSGWDAGQLEQEMSQNAWLTVCADERIVFATPVEQRWQAAARLLGVDLATLSSHAGHA
jgi:putative transcriptional regulator